MLVLENISLEFKNAFGESYSLLDGITMDIPENRITVLMGGNGVGKTTLFNIISGYQKASGGRVRLEGNDITGLEPHKIATSGVRRLFQGAQLIKGMSLLDNFKIASSDSTGVIPFSSLFSVNHLRHSESVKKNRAVEILELLFAKQCNKYIDGLETDAACFSYGEQRLLSLARIMMSPLKLVLLDEPTSGVNPSYETAIETIIRKLAKEYGVTFLIIEHNVNFIRRIADTCLYLNDGKIRVKGSPDFVLNNEYVKHNFLGL